MKSFSTIISLTARLLAGLGLSLSILFLPGSATIAAPAAQNAQCFSAPVSDDPTATVCVSRVIVVFDGTHPDNRFYVSWRTRNSEGGRVRLVGGGTFSDERGGDYEGETHYVKVNNLAAEGRYQFDVISGGETYNNSGQHWAVNVGQAMTRPGTSYFIYGYVKNPDGSDADGAIIYATIRDTDDNGTSGRSGLLSALIRAEDDAGVFTINLEEARTRNNSARFTYDPDEDQVIINAVGAEGDAMQNFRISDLHPGVGSPPTLTLGEGGTGTAATATPTLAPTETPIPTETPTETPVPPTLTATPIRLTATPRPRPPTNTPFLEPTLVEPGQTSEAVQPTAAAETLEAATIVVETNVAIIPARPAETPSPDDAPAPTRTRVIRAATATPVAVASNPFLSSNALFTALALVFFVGAMLLGLVAFIVWKR